MVDEFEQIVNFKIFKELYNYSRQCRLQANKQNSI